MSFRVIEPRDVPALFDVRVATKENAFSREALRLVGITESSVQTMLQTTHRGWLAEVDGAVIGFAMGDSRTGELWVVAVLPAWEGRGAGSQLLHLVEDWLWLLGWAELWLSTVFDSTLRAYAFYLRRGWDDAEIRGEQRYLKKKRPG